jgi:transcriptional regulator of heat shock response
MSTQNLKEKVFDKLVKIHIRTGKPIGSKILKRKYFRHLADSTIRLYLSNLVLEKLLENVKFSVGRIPTDLGWRFYLEKNLDKISEYNFDDFFNKIKDVFDIADNVSEKFKCYCIIREKRIIYEAGLENIAQNSEFKNPDILKEFAELLREIKENNDYFKEDRLKILIGGEIPFKKFKNFSLGIANYYDKKIFIITLKRVDYPKVYGLLNHLVKNG